MRIWYNHAKHSRVAKESKTLQFMGQMKNEFAAILAVMALVAGCRTIENARAVQRGVEPKSADFPVAVEREKVDLRALDLEGLVNWALTNRPNVVKAELSVESARLALKSVQSGGLLVPQVDVSLGHSQSTQNREAGHFSWRNTGNGSGRISADILIYDFGRVKAKEREAREHIVAAERALAEERLSVFGEVADAYFSVLRADALLEVALTNELEYAEHLKQSESLLEAGEAKSLDVARARVDLSNARLNTINASNDVATAGATLMKALGIESDRGGREQVLAPLPDPLSAERVEFPHSDFTADAALDFARTNSPGLLALRARLRAASAEVDYAIADLFPELSFNTAMGWSDPVWNWSWGINGVMSVFKGFRKTTAVDSAVVAMKSAETDIDAAEQQLSLSLALAVADRDNAAQSLETARVAVAQAKENLDLVAEQYKVGDANRVDFTTAVGAYAEALGRRVKAFYSGQQAEAKLIELLGARK